MPRPNPYVQRLDNLREELAVMDAAWYSYDEWCDISDALGRVEALVDNLRLDAYDLEEE